MDKEHEESHISGVWSAREKYLAGTTFWTSLIAIMRWIREEGLEVRVMYKFMTNNKWLTTISNRFVN